MNSIEQSPGVFLNEAEKHIGCQSLNKTNEVPKIDAEFLEMEYLTIVSPALEHSKRRVKNETIAGKTTKKTLPPSFLYVLSLIVQPNPFSVYHATSHERHSSYYVINHSDYYRSN